MARRLRAEVKTKAVVPLALELVLVLVVVVDRMGLQSSRLMNAGGDFVVGAREVLGLWGGGYLLARRNEPVEAGER